MISKQVYIINIHIIHETNWSKRNLSCVQWAIPLSSVLLYIEDLATYILIQLSPKNLPPGIWQYNFCWTEQEEYKLKILR